MLCAVLMATHIFKCSKLSLNKLQLNCTNTCYACDIDVPDENIIRKHRKIYFNNLIYAFLLIYQIILH